MHKLSRHRLSSYAAEQIADGASAAELARRLAAYMINHSMTKQVDLLLADINQELARRYKAVSATAATAYPMTDQLRSGIIRFIKQHEKAQSVELVETVDPSLVGGVIIRTPRSEYDNSIRTQLKSLRNSKGIW